MSGQETRTSLARAESKQQGFAAQPVGAPCQSCDAAKEQAYWVEVVVRTRLGDHALPGVHAKVAGESFGQSSPQGGFGSASAVKRKRYEQSKLTIEGHYDNSTEHLKKETFSVELSKIDAEQRSLSGVVRNRVQKIEDVGGAMRDFDFEDEYPLDADADAVEWLAPADGTGGEPILRVTVRLATFSLAVGYVNQNVKSETVRTNAHDPEGEPHAIEKTHGKGDGWSGSVLCSPTSCTMLTDYWSKALGGQGLIEQHGAGKARALVMQRYYDQWGEDGFPGRFDRRAAVPATAQGPTPAVDVRGKTFAVSAGPTHPPAWRMVAQAQPPANPADNAFWLDTSKKPHQLYRCDHLHAWHEVFAGELDLDAVPVDSGEPSDPPDGAIWRPLSLDEETKRRVVWFDGPRDVVDQDIDPLVLQWRAHEYEWDPVDEGWWRVVERRSWKTKKGTGHVEARVWQFHDRSGKVVSSFLPGDPPSASGQGFEVSGSAPLSRVLDGDTVRVKENGKWVDKPLDARPLDNYRKWLGNGWPFVVSTDATGSGHIMIVRGAVVDHEGAIHWLILNDPYGNLSSEGTLGIDVDIRRPVGGGVANRRADVEKVQTALQDAGHWEGEIDGRCTGANDDPLVAALVRFQTDVMKLSTKLANGLVTPGLGTAKRLGVEIELPVGRKDPEAVNDPADVLAVKQALEALGHYRDAEGPADAADDAPDDALDDALIQAIADFQAAHVRRIRRPDAVGHIGVPAGKGKKAAGTTLQALQGQVGDGGYSKSREKEINASGTNTGDGERGRHVYYRNTTRGSNNSLRINPGTCVRIEAELTSEKISAQLVPGV